MYMVLNFLFYKIWFYILLLKKFRFTFISHFAFWISHFEFRISHFKSMFTNIVLQLSIMQNYLFQFIYMNILWTLWKL